MRASAAPASSACCAPASARAAWACGPTWTRCAQRAQRRAATAAPVLGVHHGCGHDGHTAMLLGAARHLARTRRFDGTVVFILPAAEEGPRRRAGHGRERSVRALPVRRRLRPAQLARPAVGQRPDAPRPDHGGGRPFRYQRARARRPCGPANTHADAILAASQLVAQLNTIVARRVDPGESAVLSVTRIAGGHSHNVLPAEVQVTGTVRSFDPVSQGIHRSRSAHHRARSCPGQRNRDRRAVHALLPGDHQQRTRSRSRPGGGGNCGPSRRASRVDPAFTSEDFAFMLQARPGAYLWLGQGRGDAACDRPLHHPAYDFNDAALPARHSVVCRRGSPELAPGSAAQAIW